MAATAPITVCTQVLCEANSGEATPLDLVAGQLFSSIKHG